jgi:hypothetical protein
MPVRMLDAEPNAHGCGVHRVVPLLKLLRGHLEKRLPPIQASDASNRFALSIIRSPASGIS